jgi:uncharacterized protein HemX
MTSAGNDFVGQLGALFGAIGTIIGVWLTVRATRESNRRTATLNELAESRNAWRKDAEDLRRNLREEEVKCDELDRQVSSLQRRLNSFLGWYLRYVEPALGKLELQIPAPPSGVLDTDPSLNLRHRPKGK